MLDRETRSCVDLCKFFEVKWMKRLAGAVRRHRVIASLFAAIFVIVSIWLFGRIPLPSDEEMISIFYAHRTDIEELVRRYREFEPEPNQSHSMWLKQGDTQELLKRSVVDRIDYNVLGLWYPNPYSKEAGRLAEDYKSGLAPYNKHGVLRVKFAPRNRYFASTLRHGTIWKDFYNFPEVPRIERGMLLGPMNSKGEYTFYERVLTTLNRMPNNWRDYECVYRQIEPQWFLRMCNGH